MRTAIGMPVIDLVQKGGQGEKMSTVMSLDGDTKRDNATHITIDHHFLTKTNSLKIQHTLCLILSPISH
jgi:hypothetical protein